jgi:hypothetical protein
MFKKSLSLVMGLGFLGGSAFSSDHQNVVKFNLEGHVDLISSSEKLAGHDKSETNFAFKTENLKFKMSAEVHEGIEFVSSYSVDDSLTVKSAYFKRDWNDKLTTKFGKQSVDVGTFEFAETSPHPLSKTTELVGMYDPQYGVRLFYQATEEHKVSFGLFQNNEYGEAKHNQAAADMSMLLTYEGSVAGGMVSPMFSYFMTPHMVRKLGEKKETAYSNSVMALGAKVVHGELKAVVETTMYSSPKAKEYLVEKTSTTFTEKAESKATGYVVDVDYTVGDWTPGLKVAMDSSSEGGKVMWNAQTLSFSVEREFNEHFNGHVDYSTSTKKYTKDSGLDGKKDESSDVRVGLSCDV